MCVYVCVNVPVCVQCSDGLWKEAVSESISSGSDGHVAQRLTGRTGDVQDGCCLL